MKVALILTKQKGSLIGDKLKNFKDNIDCDAFDTIPEFIDSAIKRNTNYDRVILLAGLTTPTSISDLKNYWSTNITQPEIVMLGKEEKDDDIIKEFLNEFRSPMVAAMLQPEMSLANVMITVNEPITVINSKYGISDYLKLEVEELTSVGMGEQEQEVQGYTTQNTIQQPQKKKKGFLGGIFGSRGATPVPDTQQQKNQTQQEQPSGEMQNQQDYQDPYNSQQNYQGEQYPQQGGYYDNYGNWVENYPNNQQNYSEDDYSQQGYYDDYGNWIPNNQVNYDDGTQYDQPYNSQPFQDNSEQGEGFDTEVSDYDEYDTPTPIYADSEEDVKEADLEEQPIPVYADVGVEKDIEVSFPLYADTEDDSVAQESNSEEVSWGTSDEDWDSSDDSSEDTNWDSSEDTNWDSSEDTNWDSSDDTNWDTSDDTNWDTSDDTNWDTSDDTNGASNWGTDFNSEDDSNTGVNTDFNMAPPPIPSYVPEEIPNIPIEEVSDCDDFGAMDLGTPSAPQNIPSYVQDIEPQVDEVNEDFGSVDLGIPSEPVPIPSYTKEVTPKVEEVYEDVGSIDIDNQEQAYREATEQPKVVIKEVEVRVPQEPQLNNIQSTNLSTLDGVLRGRIKKVILVTGDRDTGITSTALNIANTFSKSVQTLYFDCDVDNHGLLSYIDYDEFRKFEPSVLRGVELCKNARAANNCICEYAKNLDLLTSDYSCEVSDSQLEDAQATVSEISSEYGVVVIDCPIDKLHLIPDLVLISQTILCVEGSKRGFMNALCRLESIPLAVRHKRAIANKGILFVTKCQTNVDTRKILKYINSIYEADEIDWLRMRIREFNGNLTKPLMNEVIEG